MQTRVPLSITLSQDLAELVRARVASGDYATASEVVEDGLSTLVARDLAVERWLTTDVGAAYDVWRSTGPATLPSTDMVLDRVRERYARRLRQTGE